MGIARVFIEFEFPECPQQRTPTNIKEEQRLFAIINSIISPRESWRYVESNKPSKVAYLWY